jgi:predicted PurR-regulated permease PerM
MSLRAVVDPEPPPERDTSPTEPDTAREPDPEQEPIRTLPTRAGLKVESVALTVIAVVAGVAALYLASGLFIPIVLTLLTTAALEPFVRTIERVGIPRWLASAMAVMGLIAALGGATYALSDDLTAAINQLPQATSRLQQEIRRLRGQAAGPIRALERAADNIDAVASEAAGTKPMAPAPPEPALRLRQSLVVGTMTLVGFTANLVVF